MSYERSDSFIFQNIQGISEFFLCEYITFLSYLEYTFSGFLMHEIIQVNVLQPVFLNFCLKLFVDTFNEFAKLFKTVSWSFSLPSCDDIHVYFTSRWVCCWLLESKLN